ncbi:hypothetical protein MMC12_003633 [Toensbergia leucococca]|nr:hypothetical protein [Toensbergia leucococca]
MVFSNQFALSLEVTRLVPLKYLADKASQAIINYARVLDHSGSDIVVENDLVEAFGRSQISSTLSSTFKNVVKSSTSSTSLWDDITLQGGPGPTVDRALQQPPFFSMVIQLSLLTWFYESKYLATEISEALKMRLEGAHVPTMTATPSREGILKVLQSCEKQTSAFNWNMLLAAVANSLAYPANNQNCGLPSIILQGAIDMFPMVQTLPQDRLVYIRIPNGPGHQSSSVCPLVVWTHHVLGLTVMVKLDRQDYPSVHFGDASFDQVIIEEVALNEESSISLLDASGEELLSIKPDPEEDFTLISSVRRLSVREWGTAFLLDYLIQFEYPDSQQVAVLRELQVVSCAFAQLIAKHLMRDDAGRLFADDFSSPEFASETSSIPHYTDPHNVITVSNILFRDAAIAQGDLNSYISAYTSKALDGQLPLPTALGAAARSCKFDEAKTLDHWDILCRQLRYLAIYIITFAHILNTKDCESLIFCGDAAEELHNHHLAQQLEDWDGKNSLYVRDDTWLQAITVLLAGNSQDIWSFPWDRVCLVSNRGWSAWLPTFAISDPEYIHVGGLFIGRGSPCRKGVWKLGVRDMPQALNLDTEPELAAGPGERVTLRCSENVTFDTPYCGEGGDVFFVYCRLKRYHASGCQKLSKIGYRDLHKSLWWAQVTNACQHRRAQDQDEFELPIGCGTLTGFGHHVMDTEERILICLTAKSIGARWLALLLLPFMNVPGDPDDQPRRIWIRSSRCCFRCAIDQAALKIGRSFLVL